MSNTVVRILVAVVAIPVILFLVYQGGWWFSAFVELLAILALKEYYDMSQAKGQAPQRLSGLLAGALFPAMLHVAIVGGNASIVAFFLLAFFMVFALWVLGFELWRGRPEPIVNTAVTVFGVVYVALGIGSLIGVRNLFYAPWLPPAANTANEHGMWLVFLMFAAIWMCDSVAYFVGRAIGRHKIAPRVSPNKSWEGGIAGLVGSAATFAIGAAFLLPDIAAPHAVVLGVLIGVVGQIGDFAESLLKRDAGIKDSSAIIPGHGGLLDRFDSILFAAPVVFVYINIVLILSRA